MGTQVSLHTHPIAPVLLVCLTRIVSLYQWQDVICLQEPIKEETSSLGLLRKVFDGLATIVVRNCDRLTINIPLIQVLAIKRPLTCDLVLDAQLIQLLVERLRTHAVVLRHGSAGNSQIPVNKNLLIDK